MIVSLTNVAFGAIWMCCKIPQKKHASIAIIYHVGVWCVLLYTKYTNNTAIEKRLPVFISHVFLSEIIYFPRQIINPNTFYQLYFTFDVCIEGFSLTFRSFPVFGDERGRKEKERTEGGEEGKRGERRGETGQIGGREDRKRRGNRDRGGDRHRKEKQREEGEEREDGGRGGSDKAKSAEEKREKHSLSPEICTTVVAVKQINAIEVSSVMYGTLLCLRVEYVIRHDTRFVTESQKNL